MTLMETQGGKGAKPGPKTPTAQGKTAATGTTAKTGNMDIVRNMAKKMLADDPKREILVLTMPMTDFADFVKDLKKLMDLIKVETNQVFIPICLSHSPINPTKDFIVVLHANVKTIPLEGWFTTNLT